MDIKQRLDRIGTKIAQAQAELKTLADMLDDIEQAKAAKQTDAFGDVLADADRSSEEWFNQFWQAYPRRQGKSAAYAIWFKLKPDETLFERIIAAVERQKQSGQWVEGYIPHPKTWLSQKRWDDEVFNGPVKHHERQAQAVERFTGGSGRTFDVAP